MSASRQFSGEEADPDEPADSLDLLAQQDRLLVEILRGWHATTPPPDTEDPGTLVRSAYDRGTYGKLLIEHVALRLAAKSDVARVLREIGSEDVADDFARVLPDARRLLDRLDELGRGVEPMAVAASVAFAGAVGELVALIRADLDAEPERTIPHIATVLGGRRSQLHSARWIHHHAPTHPSPGDRWYDRLPPLVRLQARYDHLRGFPWPRSTPMSDPAVADPIEDQG